jgi:hypothetical protein
MGRLEHRVAARPGRPSGIAARRTGAPRGARKPTRAGPPPPRGPQSRTAPAGRAPQAQRGGARRRCRRRWLTGRSVGRPRGMNRGEGRNGPMVVKEHANKGDCRPARGGAPGGKQSRRTAPPSPVRRATLWGERGPQAPGGGRGAPSRPVPQAATRSQSAAGQGKARRTVATMPPARAEQAQAEGTAQRVHSRIVAAPPLLSLPAMSGVPAEP